MKMPSENQPVLILLAVMGLAVGVTFVATRISPRSDTSVSATQAPPEAARSIASAGQTSAPSQRKRVSREAYRAELAALLKDNRTACKTADDCDAIGVGARSCGGPKEFVLLTKATKAKLSSEISDLTKIIEEMDRTQSSESGEMGICSILEKPTLACTDGACVEKSK